MNQLTPYHTSPFDAIRQLDENGHEYWSARDLYNLLGYSTWQRFHNAITRAMRSCKNSGESNVEDQFNRSVKLIKAGKGAEREIEDYKLSRYACYLVAMNADPDIPSVALAQKYFYAKTREAELAHEQLQQIAPPVSQDQITQLQSQIEQLQDDQDKLRRTVHQLTKPTRSAHPIPYNLSPIEAAIIAAVQKWQDEHPNGPGMAIINMIQREKWAQIYIRTHCRTSLLEETERLFARGMLHREDHGWYAYFIRK